MHLINDDVCVQLLSTLGYIGMLYFTYTCSLGNIYARTGVGMYNVLKRYPMKRASSRTANIHQTIHLPMMKTSQEGDIFWSWRKDGFTQTSGRTSSLNMLSTCGTSYLIKSFKNRLDQHWKQYQYSLDSIPTIRATFIRDNQEESNETIVWQAQCLFKDVASSTAGLSATKSRIGSDSSRNIRSSTS